MSVALSIIVPAYNVENYLGKCIKSCLLSSVRKFEILVIDDGSTDRTGEICDSLQLMYSKVKVFHTENCGLPSARNLGIEHAEGQYIGFVDADDYIMPGMFDQLIDAMEPGVQLTACKFSKCLRAETVVEEVVLPSWEIKDKMGAAEGILRGEYGPYVWNKLYRKDVLLQYNVRFLIDSQGAEDQFFNVMYLKYCDKVAFGSQALYNYIITEGSITSTFRNSRIVSSSYVSLPRSWRFTAEAMTTLSDDLMNWSCARATMFYQTVLRKLECPTDEYIQEACDYVKEHKSVLRKYRWGIKYYLSGVVLGISYSLWAKVFRRRMQNKEEKR